MGIIRPTQKSAVLDSRRRATNPYTTIIHPGIPGSSTGVPGASWSS